MGTQYREVQRCVNMLEALEDASKDVKVYRSHCHKIAEVVRSNTPIITSLNDILPNMNDDLNCGDVIHPLNDALEDALTLSRKCSTMGHFQKLLDNGDIKKRLELLVGLLERRFKDVELYIKRLGLGTSQDNKLVRPDLGEKVQI